MKSMSASDIAIAENVTLAGLASLRLTNSASGPDMPPVTLTYALTVKPAGASINANGIITWQPNSSYVPSTNIFTTVVTATIPGRLMRSN